MKSFALAAALVVVSAPVFALAPEAAWKANIADTNKAYTMGRHAILKIQDAAYLGEGNTASLVGQRGAPGSYKWVQGDRPGAALVAGFSRGKPVLKKDGKPLANPLADITVDKDVDVQAFPTQVEAGEQGIRVFAYNQLNPATKTFKGVDYFPYNPAFIVTAGFTPDPKLPARSFITSRRTSKQFYRAGVARFTLEGKQFDLPFYTDTNDPRKITTLSAFFTDELTGKGAYGAGRYVDSPDLKSYPPKGFKIDFNYTYNPNCARSAFFTCPVAVDHVALAVSAGERDPHLHH
ncbi:MAG TPA: DUF1684 domain-containing protein [Rhizomicrobium sp.]|jgi:hypothetical protein|nr:DUF1684 domain-containing protein [Rhizomicrobium sp.]